MILVLAAIPFGVTACSSNVPADADIVINLVANSSQFDKDTITVPAGAKVAIVFDNKDYILHNFSVYEDSTAKSVIFYGQTVTHKKTTYVFTAPSTPGTYFFRCDIHPFSMTGDFIVT